MYKNFYKVLKVSEWNRLNSSTFIITDLDKKDGFIHLSLAPQLYITLLTYFGTEDRVVLLKLDYLKIQHQIKFEPSIPSGNRGYRFPHFYGDLNREVVSKVWYLSRGGFEIPLEVMLEAENAANSDGLM
tara:strand:+ start:5396 stop:5782 length:387 start_codon:yes stop_codon:yes gene_type:complete